MSMQSIWGQITYHMTESNKSMVKKLKKLTQGGKISVSDSLIP
jgi:hypothetical protein